MDQRTYNQEFNASFENLGVGLRLLFLRPRKQCSALSGLRAKSPYPGHSTSILIRFVRYWRKYKTEWYVFWKR